MAINERRLASITYHLFNHYNNPVIAPVKTLSYHVIVCTMQGSRNEVMIYKREGREGSEARWRSELGAKEAALPVQEAERSEVRGQTLLGLTFFRLLSSSSSWRIRTSLVVSSSFSRRNSSCCRKNIRRSYVEKNRR